MRVKKLHTATYAPGVSRDPIGPTRDMDYEASEMAALEHIMSDASAEPMKLSYGLLRSITDNFSTEIGRGGFGVVYRGVLGDGDVAVKELLNLHALPEKQFLDEIMCLKRAKHNNIVKLLGYCSETQEELLQFKGANVMGEKQQKLLCFEYVAKGDIKNYLQQDKSQKDDWPLRYQMIRGICRGLQYLHGENIIHLDLKPENIMLDAQMEPKITDFGISRCLDQGQSKIITQNIRGTMRYIAPEIIDGRETADGRELSFKSDMYALGIIVIELLTGIYMIDLDNWDESVANMDCPRVRRCTEIARNCTDRQKHNRPTIVDVIRDLDELEIMVPRSSISQVAPIVFPANELLDVYPLELRFPFVPNQEMHCHLTVTNKTDDLVCCAIIPEVPGRYWGDFDGFKLLRRSTRTVTLHREAEEELPSYIDKLEMLMLIVPPSQMLYEPKLSYGSESWGDQLKSCESKGWDLHRTMLTTTTVIVSTDADGVLVADITAQKDEAYMDVHPAEPWLLLARPTNAVYVWNWHTNERIGEYVSSVAEDADALIVAKFISAKQWVVVGSMDGSILVRTCPKMDRVKEFEAHQGGVTFLAVHPTRPFLLSCSGSDSMKIWDWNRGWSCTGTFDIIRRIKHLMFNPRHTSTFATCDKVGIVETWRIGNPDPTTQVEHLDYHDYTATYFSYIGDGHFIASIYKDILSVWDLQKEKHVHTLCTIEHDDFKCRQEHPKSKDLFRLVICHPTLGLFITAKDDKSIRVWDSTTYRLKKVYENLPIKPSFGQFIGSTRLLIGNSEKISIMDIDLE